MKRTIFIIIGLVLVLAVKIYAYDEEKFKIGHLLVSA